MTRLEHAREATRLGLWYRDTAVIQHMTMVAALVFGVGMWRSDDGGRYLLPFASSLLVTVAVATIRHAVHRMWRYHHRRSAP